MEKNMKVRMMIIVELGIMAAIVLFDIWIPTLLIIAVGLLFMLLRKEGLSLLGFKIEKPVYKTVFSVFLLSVIWTIINFTVILPIINHLTDATRILTNFENLKGNTGLLLTLLAASWTLGAVGEEIAYRGFLLGGTARLFPNRKFGIVVSVLVSSVLFGLAHREQGLIGVITTFIDALFFSFVRYRFDNLWASVLAHGFLNSIGIITFYFTGPLYGLW
ncbi:MAG: CPBP family intramembrane metalloprotease [Thermotogae bacterium]|nr:CPBP family intramembrane metalloprotease [Thermotogota bacterium]